MFSNSHEPYEVEFLSRLERDSWIKSCKSLPDDWYYKTNNFTYKFNSLGHRSVEINELEKDFIFCIGCSFTEGAGLAVEHTYPYILGKTLGRTFYNAGKSGSGPDYVALTVMAILSQVSNKKPEYIIIQWPSFFRFFKFDDMTPTNPCLYHPNIQHHTDDQRLLYELMVKTQSIDNTNHFYRYWLLNCLKNYEIPNIIEIADSELPSIENTAKTKISQIKYSFGYNSNDYHDLARDLAHPGRRAQLSQANEILKYMGV